MALVDLIGFEGGGCEVHVTSSFHASGWSVSGDTLEISGTYKKTGSYALRCNSSSNYCFIYKAHSTAITRITFYLYIASAPDGLDIIAGHLSYWNLKLTTDRYLDLYEGSTKRVDGTTQLSLSTWYRISLSVNSSDGYAYYWIDASSEGSYDGTATCIAPASGDILLGSRSSVTADLYFDDFVLDDTTGSTEDLGDIRVLHAQINDYGQANDYNTTTGYGNVDDLPADYPASDENYHDAKTDVYELYGLESCSTIGLSGTDVIDAVKYCMYWKVDKTGYTLPHFAYYDAGYYSSVVPRDSASYVFDQLVFATKPSGGAWTQSAFDSFEVGQRSATTDNVVQYISACFVEVAWHVGITTYNLSISDAVELAETIPLTMSCGVSISDGIKGADSPNELGEMAALIADGVKASEVLSLISMLTMTDGTKLADASLATMDDFELSVADGIKLSESLILDVLVQLLITEGIVVSENLQFEIPSVYLYVSVTDGVKGAESLALTMESWVVSTDGLKIGEAILEYILAYVSTSDGLKAGDTTEQVYNIMGTILDGFKLGDPVSLMASVMQLLVTDGVKFSEAVLAVIEAIELLAVDGLKVGDLAQLLTTMLPEVVDSVEFSEALALTMAVDKAVSDAFKVGDSTLLFALSYVSLLEGIKVGDTTLISMLCNQAIQDGIKLSELLQPGRDGILIRAVVFTRAFYNMVISTRPYYNMVVFTRPYYNMKVFVGGQS